MHKQKIRNDAKDVVQKDICKIYCKASIIIYSIDMCGGQNLSLCAELKISFFNNNASEEKKVWGKAP